MLSADELKLKINRIWGVAPGAMLSLRIIDFLTSVPSEQLSMLTFGNLCRVVGKPEPDKDLLTAINILVSSKVQVLETHMLFIDDNKDEHEIDLKDLQETRRSGVFIHPRTGEMINNFEAHFVPFFVPSQSLREGN